MPIQHNLATNYSIPYSIILTNDSLPAIQHKTGTNDNLLQLNISSNSSICAHLHGISMQKQNSNCTSKRAPVVRKIINSSRCCARLRVNVKKLSVHQNNGIRKKKRTALKKINITSSRCGVAGRIGMLIF